jgi:hypothetical protein
LSATNITQADYTDFVWIGLQGNVNNDGIYQWTDGSCINYLNWAVNQPNDYADSEHCVQLMPDVDNGAASYWSGLGGTSSYYQEWNDISCSSPMRAFVCKGLLN